MAVDVVNLVDKFAKFSEHWSPKIVARMNDYHLKLAKIQGEFVWHSHAETDEVFMVVSGEMRIEFREGEARLAAGEMCVVPRGMEHRPRADRECQLLLIELAGTVNTGEAGGEFTQTEEDWI